MIKYMAVVTGLAFMLISGSAEAQKRTTRYLALTGQALTTSAPVATTPPTTSTSLKLLDVTSWHLMVCADSGNLTGGTVVVYEYKERPTVYAEWRSFTITTTGPCQVFDDIDAPVFTASWLTPKTTSVTVSAGTTVSLYFYATVEVK